LKKVAVYYQYKEGLQNEKALNDMKLMFDKERWILYGIFLDKEDQYDALLKLITNNLLEVDILYVYSMLSIEDDFYFELVEQSAKAEKVDIIEYEKIK
jgi:hypothetical protein